MLTPAEISTDASAQAPATGSKETRARTKKGELFGRYREIVLLVIGFFLTTILGALSGAWLQRQQSEQVLKAELARAEQRWLKEQALADLDKASRVHEKIVKLMDSRLHYMSLLLGGYKSKDTPPQKIKQHEDTYNKVFNEWNENRNLNIALISLYFGPEMQKRLEEEIMGEFARINNEMQRERQYSSSLERRLNNLQHKIYVFNQKIRENLQERRAAMKF